MTFKKRVKKILEEFDKAYVNQEGKLVRLSLDEATNDIIKAVEEMLPEEKELSLQRIKCGNYYTDKEIGNIEGHNKLRQQIKKGLK